MAASTAFWSVRARRVTGLEVEVGQVLQAELVAQAGPEVLLVDHAEGHLPIVRGGEEAVARNGLGFRGGCRRPVRGATVRPVQVDITSVIDTSR